MQVHLTAPEGVTHFSHAGHEFRVGDDGTVTVEPNVAEELEHHGFERVLAVAAPSETVVVKRETVLAAIEALGASAHPALRADKLSAAFEAAVKAKEVKKPSEKPTLSLGGNKTAAA